MAYRGILARRPHDFDTLHMLGLLKLQQGQLADATHFLSAAVHSRPDAVEALSNLGMILARLGRHAEALANFDRILAINRRDTDAHFSRAVVLGHLGRFAEALTNYQQVLAARPDDATVWSNRGSVLFKLARYAEALESFDRALALKPDLADAWSGRGNVFFERKQYGQALEAYDKALAYSPNFTEAWNGCASIFCKLKRYQESLTAFDKVLASNPDYAEAWCGRGHMLMEIRQYDEAFVSYDKALRLKPDMAEAYFGRGNLLVDLKRHDVALASYDKAMMIKPDLKYLAGMHLTTKMSLCDWRDYDNACVQIVAAVQAGHPASPPFVLLTIPSSANEQLQCAQMFVAENCSVSDEQLCQGERYAHDRIRIAYLSADFHHHATAFLMAELFERHDRSRFEIFAISFGVDDRSEMRARLIKAFDQFHDVRTQSDRNIAQLMNGLQIDIAIDLKGYTQDSRPAILAHRPAPIQVNYLGYPGTMGADFMDYIIADKTILPFDQQQFYTEKIIHLSDSYQVNDTKRKISPQTPTRADAGLPDQGFVFCCFNNNYKINPQIFEIWMRLLQSVDGSVLWLLRGNASAEANLRKEAMRRGVDPTRLLFANRLPLEDHLSRHHLADLFLDTLPYNAHTTASDALWAGLPVLTCQGETFAGRVAASLLHAVGLLELATTKLDDYEALALKLARDPALLAGIRAKLARNRETCPLFNTERFTRHIEAAYTNMWERWQRGEPPESFSVKPIAG